MEINSSSLGSVPFQFVRRFLDFIFLTAHQNEFKTSFKVTIKAINKTLGKDAMRQYKLMVDFENRQSPSMLQLISSNPFLTTQHSFAKDVQMFRVQQNDSSLQIVTEKLLVSPGGQFEVVTSESSCTNSGAIGSCQMSCILTLVQQTALLFTSKLKSYLNILHAVWQSLYIISLHLLDGENEIDISFNDQTDDDVVNVLSDALAVCSTFYYKQRQESDLIVKKSNPVVLLDDTNSPNYIKLKLSVIATTFTLSNDRGGIYVYVLGPGGLPVINESDVSTDRLAPWEDYGIKMDEAYEHKEKDDILEPFLAYNINTDFQQPLNVVAVIAIDAVTNWQVMEERIVATNYVQGNIGQILRSNSSLVERSFTQALNQLLPRTKDLKRMRTNELSVVNIVTSIHDIVTLSTNDIFRETCMSLMGSATSHGLQDDLYTALTSIAQEKLERKRRKNDASADVILLFSFMLTIDIQHSIPHSYRIESSN
ncbi:unnamed protein product [Clavelina lepadiformis]|uniref:Uncharacterized protein n=1 Tax=Clavelina lepadiformis TaxID=159417 RepID=A0ABP0F7G0_CLALP